MKEPQLFQIVVQRGDVQLSAMVPAEEMAGTAVNFLELIETLAADYPMMLPHAEHVGGLAIPVNEDEIFEEGRQQGPLRAGRPGIVGFHAP